MNQKLRPEFGELTFEIFEIFQNFFGKKKENTEKRTVFAPLPKKKKSRTQTQKLKRLIFFCVGAIGRVGLSAALKIFSFIFLFFFTSSKSLKRKKVSSPKLRFEFLVVSF